MLTRLGLGNFKPFRAEHHVPLAPITLIYGPNSGGKSSIIQALALLRQSVDAAGTDAFRLIPRGRLVDLGSYGSLVHEHDVSRDVSFLFGFDSRRLDPSPSPWPSLLPPLVGCEVHFRFTASDGAVRLGAAELAEITYRVRDHERGNLWEFAFVPCAGDPSQASLFADYEVAPPSASRFTWSGIRHAESYADFLGFVRQRWTRHLREQGESLSFPGLGLPPAWKNLFAQLEQAGGPAIRDRLRGAVLEAEPLLPGRLASARERHAEVLSSVLSDVGREAIDHLKSIDYHGPLRSHPARHYIMGDAAPGGVGVSGEFTAQVLYRREKEIGPRLNTWFNRFEVPYRLSVRPTADPVIGDLLALVLTDRRSGIAVGPSDVGFGIGQLLPILVAGLVSTERVLCVEQPEIHLHPRLQAHLADFLIETAGASRDDDAAMPPGRNQWIVETHSEALVLRLQRRVREGRLDRRSVRVLYVEPGTMGSRVTELRLDDTGEFLDEWPHGFFEEDWDEMFGAGPR